MRIVPHSSLAAAAILAVCMTPGAAWTPAKPVSGSLPRTTSPRAIAVPLDEPRTTHSPTSEQSTPRRKMPAAEAWVENLDYEGFGKEVTHLGKELLKGSGDQDVAHLNKMLKWRDAAAAIGLATMWMAPNPVTILALSTWTYASWTVVAHHTCHGGYNRVDAGKFNSRGFALGNLQRRVSDWLDWMKPEAWNVEHNRLHHYRLNEVHDPDLVQRNLGFLRDSDMPMYSKYAIVFAFMPIWKWFYYAPNTFKELQLSKWQKESGNPLPKEIDPLEVTTVRSLVFPGSESQKALLQIVNPVEFFSKVLGPFFLMRYVLIPMPLLAVPGFGPSLYAHAIINLIAAELLTNLHAFITIVTNHAGEDMYTFDDAVKPKTPSFYVRQIVGSANYHAGNDLLDFSHGFLNYQIEHHVWPDLSMRQYQIAAPQLQAICDKYGVPYIQESVFERLRKTVDVMVGNTSMKRFPTELEPAKDKAVNGIAWKSDDGAIDEHS